MDRWSPSLSPILAHRSATALRVRKGSSRIRYLDGGIDAFGEPALETTEPCTLIPFGDLDESVLYKFGNSSHGIRVDLDAGKQVFISPMMGSRGSPAKLDLHTAFYEIRGKLLVRVAGGHIALGIVCLVVESNVA